jgi:hypothetical protein
MYIKKRIIEEIIVNKTDEDNLKVGLIAGGYKKLQEDDSNDSTVSIYYKETVNSYDIKNQRELIYI